jgi:L-lactate dehydrogenase complex protein LldE
MRVALQVTCLGDALFPDVGKATVTLLRRLGVEVDFPAEQTCCGQPMINSGYLDEAVPAVRSFARAFEGYDAIVTPSGSCAGAARHQHAMVARRAGDQGLADAVAQTGPRTHELSEFLVDVLGVTDVGASFPHAVTYHPTCHSLRMLGVSEPGGLSFLGVAMFVAVCLVALLPNLLEVWMIVVAPILSAITFWIAHWIVTRFDEDILVADDGPPPHDVR